nr:hypothetical protein [Tanacetum cinerariifolium]GEY25862.1 hypothetical protein [Tanacetum cinerariifolium]
MLATSNFLVSSKLFKKPLFSSMDNSKRINDFTEKYSVFEVNYDGVLFELPLRYEYGKVLSLKLSNSNRMSYSEMLDMLVYKLECEIHDCVDDHFDTLDYWNYEDVYFSGYFDVGCSCIGCDWIDERVGYTDRLLLDISKAKFSKEALLNDDGSSSTTSLSLVLKRKGK